MTITEDRTEASAPEVGKARVRKEDDRLITGRTRWTDNITLPGMLHLAMVRSPFAHASITSVDVEAAKASPNVVAVLSGKDFGDELGVCINAWPITPDQKTPTHSPMPADRVASWDLPSDPEAVGTARTAAVRQLSEWGLDDLAFTTELIVSELVTNAIRHARPLADGCLRVRWKVRGEVVELEVTDGGGDTAPVPAPAAVWVSSGRGLRIIRSLAHEWGVGEDKGGQTVWAAVGGPSRRRAT